MRILVVGSVLVCLAAAADIMDGTKKLLLSQAVWRHGDRSPTKTYAGDPFQEPDWKFGGGGFGQLSPLGMRQHVGLGQKIRKMYVDSGYLSPYYNSKEMYVRSTDVNRTIISAMSNMIGMFGQPGYGNRAETDYPDMPEWPVGYIPIAVHTVDDDTDYIGNADAVCDRQTKLWDMAKTSPELVAFQNSANVADLLKMLSQPNRCNEVVDIDNLWIVADSFLIEGIYFNQSLPQKVPWWNPQLNQQIILVNDQAELYQNGVFNSTVWINGLNIGLEIQKIRGGSLTNDINMHMNLKLDCLANNDTSKKCQWINKLKYYAYSAHDTTIYAFFSVLGVQSSAVAPHGYPHYSAATIVELWQDTVTLKNYFKLLYHSDAAFGFDVITNQVAGCNATGSYCDIDVYRRYAANTKPDQDMSSWCKVDPTIPRAAAGLSIFTGLLAWLLVARP